MSPPQHYLARRAALDPYPGSQVQMILTFQCARLLQQDVRWDLICVKPAGTIESTVNKANIVKICLCQLMASSTSTRAASPRIETISPFTPPFRKEGQIWS